MIYLAYAGIKHSVMCLSLVGLWVPDARSAGLTPANEQLQKELEAQGQLPVEEEVYEDADDLGLD